MAFGLGECEGGRRGGDTGAGKTMKTEEAYRWSGALLFSLSRVCAGTDDRPTLRACVAFILVGF